MDKTARKRIGILLVSADIGVVYYLLSIIKSLTFLNDKEKPQVLLFCDSTCEKYLDLFDYEYLTVYKIEYHKNKKIKYLLSIILQKNLFITHLVTQYKLDGIFPAMDIPVKSHNSSCTIASWIPDFQHKFYPGFFTKRNLVMREARFKQIIFGCDTVVLSSNDAYSHLKQFYKTKPGKPKVQVMPFVSMIRDFKVTDFEVIKSKYNINTPFFLVSNQFYAHKNHMVVLEAIKELAKINTNFMVFLTGKTEDYRNPLFFKTLTNFIENNNLQKQAVILGLIPREDQLSLLEHSLSVIQPSRFEGWSTIIEDAKTLNKQVICSNIDVHVEQMRDKAFYFEPDSFFELSSIMNSFISENQTIAKPIFNDYEQRIRDFAHNFLNVFN